MTEPQLPGTESNKEPAVDEAADDERDTTHGLPDVIEPGDFDFTFKVDTGDGEPTSYWVSFSWEGLTHADWLQDIGDDEGFHRRRVLPYTAGHRG